MGDGVAMQSALERYEDIDFTFSGSREGKLLKACPPPHRTLRLKFVSSGGIGCWQPAAKTGIEFSALLALRLQAARLLALPPLNMLVWGSFSGSDGRV